MIHLTKIIAAILVLLAIALGGYAWVLSRTPVKVAPVAATPAAVPSATTPSAPTYAVVVTAKPVAAGQPITSEALRVEQLPINPTGAFKETAPLVGRVPVFDLGAGTPLLEGQLASGLAMRVEEGERAVAIKADEVMGVGNKVQPGDFVDVFVMLKFDGKDVDRSQARLLLSRKRVLAFGNSSVDALPSKTADGNGNPSAQQQRNETVRTAVLAVPVEDINRLTLGESTGRLLLALRNPLDMNQPDPSLLAVLPVALPPPPSKRGEPLRGPLEGLDVAQAGLTAADLVTGGSTGRRPIEPRGAYAAPTSSLRQPGTGARPGLEVEMIRGDRSETLRY